MKYQVGDTVKILKNSNGSTLPIGHIGKIVGLAFTSYYIDKVTNDTSNMYEEDELELITNSKPKIMGRRKFQLLKDTPEYKKGAIFEEMCDDGTQDFKLITPEFDKFPQYGETAYFRDVVINNPKWFREVTYITVFLDQVEKVKKMIKKIK